MCIRDRREAVAGGRLHRFPAGPLDSLRTTLLSAREKVALSSALAALWRADGPDAASLTLAEWLDRSWVLLGSHLVDERGGPGVTRGSRVSVRTR